MIRVLINMIIGIGLVSFVANANADDLLYGEYLAGECTSCHSPSAENIPSLEGMEPDYFIEAMKDYASGERENQVMQNVALSLGEAELRALALWFKTQGEQN